MTNNNRRFTRFLAALTVLSREHGIGVSGVVIPFLMTSDDGDRVYRFAEDDRIEFI